MQRLQGATPQGSTFRSQVSEQLTQSPTKTSAKPSGAEGGRVPRPRSRAGTSPPTRSPPLDTTVRTLFTDRSASAAEGDAVDRAEEMLTQSMLVGGGTARALRAVDCAECTHCSAQAYSLDLTFAASCLTMLTQMVAS